jgi:fumarate reductase flavoprotein subunit
LFDHRLTKAGRVRSKRSEKGLSVEIFKADVAIVGGGRSRAARSDRVAQSDPRLKIALISKVYPMRSHTVAAEGGAAGVKRDDSLDYHFHDTVAGGDWLCEQDVVDYFVKHCTEEMVQLEHWGCPWSRTPDGHVNVRAFGGMKIERTWFAADKSGFHMLHTLFQTSMQYPSIKRFDEHFCVDLLVEDGRCQGVVAVEIATGEFVMIEGGVGDHRHRRRRARVPREHQRRHRHRRRHGAGLPPRRAAARHGIRAVPPDLHAGTGLLFTEACRGEGGFLVNKDGYRYLQDYGLGPLPTNAAQQGMELGPRDRLSQAFWYEQQKGRTIEGIQHRFGGAPGPAPPRRKKLRERLPLIYELAETFMGIDPAQGADPGASRQCITRWAASGRRQVRQPLPGLYAAGECSSVGIHGANRLGSNSLSESAVFGKVAGETGGPARTLCCPGNSASLLKQAQAAQQALKLALAPGPGQRESRCCARKWRRRWKTAAASTAPARACSDLRQAGRTARALQPGRHRRQVQRVGTPSGCWPSNSTTSSTWRNRWRIRR